MCDKFPFQLSAGGKLEPGVCGYSAILAIFQHSNVFFKNEELILNEYSDGSLKICNQVGNRVSKPIVLNWLNNHTR